MSLTSHRSMPPGRLLQTFAGSVALVIAAAPLSMPTPLRAEEIVTVEPIQRIRRSILVDRPCAVVWPYLNDFSGIGNWYKAFRSVRYHSGPRGQVGEIREIVRASNGQLVREKLIYLDPESLELAYSHVLNPPARDIVTLVSLQPVAQAQCQVSWSNTFRLKPGQQPAQVSGFFTKAYGNVLQGLKTYVEAQTPEPPVR
ncbi:MAG: SRPBCC family protein [Cyanobium sp.]